MQFLARPGGFWFRLSLTMTWLVLIGLVVRRELMVPSVSISEQQILEEAQREEYQGVYFRDRKIGYVVNRYQPEEGNLLRLEQQAHMNLNVGSVVQRIDLLLEARLHADSTLESFNFEFSSPFYQMSAAGNVEGNRVDFTLTTGSNTIADSLTVASPPMVATARRGYLLREGLEAGDRLKVPWFDPVSLTAKESVIEYRGRERVRIRGRVHNLHKFTENFGGARVSLWLSDEGDVMKEESPAGFVFVKEPKFQALELAESSDELLSAVAVQVTGAMPDLAGRYRMRYRLGLPADENFDLDEGRQRMAGDILTIERETIPPDFVPEMQPSCPDIGDSLESSPYIQASSERIGALAREILEAGDGRIDQVRKLADWVFRNLEKRPVLGIPDALTTLENLKGDCNEHAALFAALARNSGIPARIAAGVMYHQGAFYYHAWNEVCVGGRWLTLDATTNQFPADLSHIKFVQGELDQQLRIGALLGRLVIEPLPEREADGQEEN